jgi:hypoxanthine-DNA glycosylase
MPDGKEKIYECHDHTFGPVYDPDCTVLILGSFPSVLSRKQNFYYGHPQNRFWKLLPEILNEPVPENIEEKKRLVLRHHIALWDVLESCEICGSSDSSIRNEKPVDIRIITESCKIRKIFTNGGTAKKMYDRYLRNLTGMEACCLPSTSPANAVWSLEKLKNEWNGELKKWL